MEQKTTEDSYEIAQERVLRKLRERGVPEEEIQKNLSKFQQDPATIIKKPEGTQKLYRYMSFAQLCSSLLNGSLTYVSPYNFPADVFEGKPPYPAPYKELYDNVLYEMYRKVNPFDYECPKDEYIRKYGASFLKRDGSGAFYISCWNASSDESFLMWHAYGKGADSVCVMTDYATLDKQIKGNADIFAGLVNYIDYSTSVVPALAPFFYPFPLFYKRKQFREAKEFRMVMKRDKSSRVAVSLPVDWAAIIHRIYLNPEAGDWILDTLQLLLSTCGLDKSLASFSTIAD